MDKSGKKLKTLKRVLGYLKYNIWLLMASLLLALISVICTLYVPILSGQAVDAMIGKGGVNWDVIFRVLRVGGVVIAVAAVAQWFVGLCNNRLTASVVCRMRRDALAAVFKLPLSYLDNRSQGDMVSRIMNDVDTFSDGLLLGLTQLFSGIVTIAVTMIFMLYTNWKIAVLVIVMTPLSMLTAGFISGRTYHLFKQQATLTGQQSAVIEENIENQKLIRLFNRQGKQTESFDSLNEELKKTALKATFFSSLTNPTTRFINALVYAGVALTGSFLILGGGSLSIGELTCLLSYANQYTKPFNEISGVIAEFQNALACAERVFYLIDEPCAESKVSGELNLPVRGEIELKDVCFSYRKDTKLIENFSLLCKPGEKIAIVGPTGCGKTTLINLLMRFYEPDSGRIVLDSVDYKDVEREEVRSAFGMVLQDTWLKAGTIKENIAFGTEQPTDEQIVAAAKASHADGFIRRLPKGYNTMINEEGGNLSPGQKQLLCIARVMLWNPSILILDEATSSIDTRTEIKIQDAFLKLMEGRTSFIVAHRLTTILGADRILVMNAGKVVEQGTHKELLAQDGFYAKLYRSRSGEVSGKQ